MQVVDSSTHLILSTHTWLSTDPTGRVRVLITGQYGFERRVVFAQAEEMSVITDMVRRTLEDDVD